MPDSSPNEGHRQRLRERFVRSGLDGFADYEVVELILTLAIPRVDVKKPAKLLISKFGDLRGILDASPEELKQIKGIGSVAPVALRIIKEATSLYLQQTAEQREYLGDLDSLSRFWRSRIGALSNEVFEVGYLDSRLRLQRNGVERMEEGTTDRATVYPRMVIEAALKRKAAALVFAHNHPNGDVKPTEQDKLLTRALVLAAARIKLKNFVIPNTELIPEEVRSKVKKWPDYIDYWAIDWDFQNDTFMQGWVNYRTRKDRSLALVSDAHTYEKAGRYRVLVKVVDIFGNDTTQAFDVDVK